MAETAEHQYLSQTFLAILETFSRSKLYSYRESDRGKFDIACMLTESWDYLLNGQTLWKHSEGIDKDLRTLLVASDAPLLTYVARDTTRHRSVFSEAMSDYRKVRDSQKFRHFRVFWVPFDFDADSEQERRLVESQLRHDITEDVLLNVLFGRLDSSRVHAAMMMHPSTEKLGLELAVLHSIAVEGFTSLGWLSHKFHVSSGTVRERISRLQVCGLVIQKRAAGQGYSVGPAGRAMLRLCSQVYKVVNDGTSLSSESIEIMKMLGMEPFEVEQADYVFSRTGVLDRNDPRLIFGMLMGKAQWAASLWNVDWEECDYKYAPDEHDNSLWLAI